MKNVTRVLGLGTAILWIAILILYVAAVLSARNLDFSVGELQSFPSREGVVLGLPFFVKNEGYFDLTNLNVTARITDFNGTLITHSTTFIPMIPRGSRVEAVHNISIKLQEVISSGGTPLLFTDGALDLDLSIMLNFGYALPVRLSMNATIPWGAPFSSFSVGEIAVSGYNSTHGELMIPISFENHSGLTVAGTLHLEIYTNIDTLAASGKTDLNIPSQQGYSGQVYVYPLLDTLSGLTEQWRVHLIFKTDMFTVDWWMPHG